MNIIQILGSLALVALAVWAAWVLFTSAPVDSDAAKHRQTDEDCQCRACHLGRASNVG